MFCYKTQTLNLLLAVDGRDVRVAGMVEIIGSSNKNLGFSNKKSN